MKNALPIILVLAVCGMLAAYFIWTKPNPKKKTDGPLVTRVVTEALARASQPVAIPALGIVQPMQGVTLQTEVAGRVVWVSDALVAGGAFRKDEPVLRIDDRDYQNALAQREAELAQARMNLRVEEGQQRVAQEDWRILKDEKDKVGADRDLVLRRPQYESAATAVKAAESALAKAKLDLERTTLRAPFNATVLSESVDIGQVLSSQTAVAALAGTDQYRVQVSVPVEVLPFVTVPGASARVGADTTAEQGGEMFPGRVAQLLADADTYGRLARLLVTIDRPLSAGRHPLLLNTTVRVVLDGTPVENAWRVPRKAVHDGNRAWVMTTEGVLAERELDVAYRDTETLVVSGGFLEGDRLIVSRLSAPVPGMALREAGDAAAATTESGTDMTAGDGKKQPEASR